ncbi:MAG: cytochrome c [Syntrophales bacterium]|nr:cytochrome c [Syntrophales bacterium]
MTGKTAKAIFWLGTLSSAIIFLWLTYDFHQQEPKFVKTDKLNEQVVAGKKVWHKHNCNDCHTILGFGGYYAPDMTKAYYRLGESAIISVVMNPEQAYKDTFRKMPHLGVTKDEAVNMAAFLKWVASIDNRTWPPQDEKFVKAFQLREANAQKPDSKDIAMGACGGCHSLGDLGNKLSGDFNDISQRISYDRDTLVKFIHAPQSVRQGIAMPPQNISSETAAIIADFLLSLKAEKEVQK